MTNNVTLNQFRPYEDSDETHYWIDIHGVRLPLTKSQFVAMHDARIQLWDMATEHTEQRIIKLLEERFDDTALWRQIEWSPDVYEGFNKQELIELIKGQNK